MLLVLLSARAIFDIFFWIFEVYYGFAGFFLFNFFIILDFWFHKKMFWEFSDPF